MHRNPTTDPTFQYYETSIGGTETVFAFDTDYTVDYANGPVPLRHVIDLRERPSASVWATGNNQSLRDYAKIPGVAELKVMVGATEDFPDRADRMRYLSGLFPESRKIVVDDVDLTVLEPGWEYYTPWEYCAHELGMDVEPRGPQYDYDDDAGRLVFGTRRT